MQDTKRTPSLVMFRDWDLWYKPPFYDVNWSEYNKTGYVSEDGLVIYPFGRGLRNEKFEEIRKKKHTLVPLSFMSNLEGIETFFTKNRPNVNLFFQGLHALGRRDDSFFESPIRLPILPPLSDFEFEKRWEQLLMLLRPADQIMIIDTASLISKAIAAIDHGTWSHVGGYVGNGRIFEMILSGAVERSLDVYRSPRYRIGLYRVKDVDVESPESIKKGDAFIAYCRASIGRARYNYLGLIRLGAIKILGIRKKSLGDHDLSPNDMAIFLPIELILTI